MVRSAALQTRTRGINLTDFLMLLGLLCCGLLAAGFGESRWGSIGLVLGFAIGLAGTLGGLFVIVSLACLVEGLSKTGLPWLPACRNGTCRSKTIQPDLGDYDFEHLGEDRWGYRCRCGLLYRKVGGRFLEVTPEGDERPYLVWRALRGWREDVSSK